MSKSNRDQRPNDGGPDYTANPRTDDEGNLEKTNAELIAEIFDRCEACGAYIQHGTAHNCDAGVRRKGPQSNRRAMRREADPHPPDGEVAYSPVRKGTAYHEIGETFVDEEGETRVVVQCEGRTSIPDDGWEVGERGAAQEMNNYPCWLCYGRDLDMEQVDEDEGVKEL